ncbi:MAG: RNA-binding S4 domain-containing protein, partial [Gammaproteobacteria bacterium]
MPDKAQIENRTRLDKWLWAARFFKTRAIAAQAVTGGKVHLMGQRVKASRQVKIDDCYEIRRGQERLEVIVQALSQRRGSAVQAQL